MKKIIVLGGGPAGMMAAESAAGQGAAVALIEQNRILGKKLLITGKGRCNITNFCSETDLIGQVVTNPKFLYSAFSAFSAYDTYAFFENLGVPLKVERGNRVFPLSDRASDVRDALKRRLIDAGVQIIEDQITKIGAGPFLLEGKNGRYTCDRLILATGGLSYPLTGSTGDGLRFAASLGHSVIKPEPALVPLLEQGNLCGTLAGLTLKNVQLTMFGCKANELYKGFGEMLFTHQGISGPLVLSASSFMKADQFPATAEIDLKPALTADRLDQRLIRDFTLFANRDFHHALERLLPRKLIPVIVAQSGIAPDLKTHQVTREQRLKLVYIMKHFRVKLLKKSGFSEAIITSGGVDVAQVRPQTMESRLVPGLFFAGEILDVDALTGGYNLQIAYATGRLAGRSAARED